jgi:hypothetical protein
MSASFFSTVTPGQLPTYRRLQAMALIRVDLPALEFSATATTSRFCPLMTESFLHSE